MAVHRRFGAASRRTVLLVALAGPAFGQAPGQPVPAGVPASRFPAPVRPVASIVSDQWATEDSRERVGEAKTVMDLLGIGPGMSVADIGAGSGYYTVRLSARVGPEGRVLAQDIVPRYLDGLRRRVAREGLRNVAVSQGEPHDPLLPPGSVDVALLVHMYHEVEQPFGLLYNLLPALRPGARVAILDTVRPTPQHGTPPPLLRCELAAVGYKEVAFHPLEKGAEYLAVFAPPERALAPEAIRPCRG